MMNTDINEIPAGYVKAWISESPLIIPVAVQADRVAQKLVAKQQEVEASSVLEEKQAATPSPAPECAESNDSWWGTIIQVFNLEALGKRIQERKSEDNERAARQLPGLEAARTHEGTRRLFEKTLPEVVANLRELKSDMPNFAGVVDLLAGELALALAGPPEQFRVSPILMNGAPGIGKTRFANEVARILDVGFESIALGSTNGGFELTGTASGYGNSRAGRIFTLLAEGESACPVVLLDEVDKMTGDDRFPVLPAVLDLMEEGSAKRFRDEALELRIDASKIIFMGTSNEVDLIPAPLLSRMRLVEIQPPTPKQRRAITCRIALEFVPLGIEFKPAMLDALSHVDMDLRALRRFLREAAGRALASGKNVVATDDVSFPTKIEKKMGFVY